MRKPFIAGNWKMFKNKSEAVKFADQFKSIYKNKNVEKILLVLLKILISYLPQTL